MNYENRIVLFLDILGFKKIVSDTIIRGKEPNIETDNKEKILALHDILLKMGEIAGVHKHSITTNVTQFSDSLVISFLDHRPDKAATTFRIILKLIVELIKSRIICRGAISYGKLIHNSEMIFGPALIDAYETESRAAMYPRVIMDKKIYDFARIYNDPKTGDIVTAEGVGNYLKVDLDSKYYIDYFNHPHTVVDDPKSLIEYYEALREIIINGRKLQAPDLKVKYGWMRAKYNRLLSGLTRTNNEIGLPREVFDYLIRLKKIN